MDEISSSWKQLSNYLINPISEYIERSKMVYFIPYGRLHKIAFHCLPFREVPLIKVIPVAYLPAASLLKYLKSKPHGIINTLTSIAASTDEFDEGILKEAKDVAELFEENGTAILNATKEQVLSNLVSDILHFSCHGEFDFSDPFNSKLVLANNDELTAREILRLNCNAKLVTLSACESGKSEVKPSDELLGFIRSFLYSGASSLIVSLWKCDIDQTRLLMINFYKFIKKGYNTAKALQQAQIEIMNNDEYENPHFWAPFILVGSII
jgi:CHAT domain-containing protein